VTSLQGETPDPNAQASGHDSSSANDEEQPMDVDGAGASVAVPDTAAGDDVTSGKHYCHFKSVLRPLKYQAH